MRAETQILDASAAALRDTTAQQIMQLSFLDWLACGLAGQDEPTSRITRDMILSEASGAQATLFGGAWASARGAALANGTASHALDYDDTHFAHIGHPSVVVISAAMAEGQRCGASLHAILDAALMGCEASIRFGLLFGRGHYQAGFHQTATAGAFGAVVACGRLSGLSDGQMQHALSLVTTRASGLKAQFGSMGKPYNAGLAAANGVEVAQLAALGMTSSEAALEGVNGFLATHHCDGSADQPDAPLMLSISHKFHACCHGLHAALEALALLPECDPARVRAVTVETHPRWLTVCNIAEPTLGLELKFSYRAILAAALLANDTARLDTYADALCCDPALVALRDRVTVVGRDSLGETEALVRIETDQGDMESHFDLEAPMPLPLRRQKIVAKAAALIGEAKVQRLLLAMEDDDLLAVIAEMAT